MNFKVLKMTKKIRLANFLLLVPLIAGQPFCRPIKYFVEFIEDSGSRLQMSSSHVRNGPDVAVTFVTNIQVQVILWYVSLS